MMMPELRPYQQQALDDIRASVGQGVRRLAVQAPTGAGKTLLAGAIVQGAIRKNNPTAFVVSNLSLIDQTLEMFAKQGITDVGVVQADHYATDWSKPVQICSIQTVLARGVYPKAKVVVIDECFVAGTLVQTPNGEVPIERLRIGDSVVNATGQGRVLHTSRRAAQILTIRLSNGRTIRTTANHPFFTASGWRRAGELEVGSRLYSEQGLRALWQAVPATADNARIAVDAKGILHKRVRQDRPGVMALFGRSARKSLFGMRQTISAEPSGLVGSERNVLEKAGLLLSLLREETLQSDALAKCSLEVKPHLEASWAWTKNTRRERATAYEAAVGDIADAWGRMDTRVRGADWISQKERERLSDQLQARHCKSRDEDWDRDRWERPCGAAQITGHQEGQLAGDVRVEDISRDKQAGIEPVFNLHISGHPSYFADGVLVHNCHKLFKAHIEWLNHPDWKDVPFIGLSATPWTKGLGKYFESLQVVATTQELIDQNYLSKFRVFASDTPDLSSVKVVAGDYQEKGLSEVMREEGLTANIIETYKQKWNKDKTLCFAVDRAHAKQLQDRFIDAGIACGYQDGNTPADERAEVKKKFHDGRYQVVVNIMTLTTGTDWDVRCLILARPTKSEMLYTQIIGRALRTAEGKEHAIILDHTDTTSRLGFVTDIIHEALDDGKLDSNTNKANQKPLPKPCPKCTCLIPVGAKACPSCGFERVVESKIVEREGQLQEFIPGRPRGKTNNTLIPYTMAEKARFYAQLKGLGIERGYAEGWSAHKFKEKFGVWPDWSIKTVSPLTAGPEVRQYVKSRLIAYANRRDKGAPLFRSNT